MPRPPTLIVAGAVALGLAASAPAVSAAPAPASAAPGAQRQAARITGPTARVAWRAEVLYPVEARAKPASRSKIVMQLAGQTQYGRTEQVLLVLARRGAWVRVALPQRPNGSKGWIPLAAVRLHRTPFRVRVNIARRSVEILRSGVVFKTYRAAVGAARTPTPLGLFATTEIIPTQARDSRGPLIVVLTAYSDVLTNFLGGDGVAGLHGWFDAGAFGKAVSNGCVRVAPQAIQRIATYAPAGTPVEVVAN